ncbi:MAG: Jag N-terminal domain-containing protein [Chloroflexi bacterium]|nr:Jag N-terminal domain-containing protein [Chloroflexota bacterium]MDA1281408.1 Jag N-terminal domain-containing protein [Chloroflexota bacterium]
MIRARKYAGKTVDEATEIALADLDAELEDVEIKIVSTGRSGILGFGGEPAEIEISLLSDGRSSFSDDFDEEAVADSPEESAESAPRAASADFEEETPRNRGRSRNRNRGRGRGRSNRDGDEEQQPEAVASSSEAPAREATDEEKPSNGRRGRRGARGGRDAERSPSNERDERPEAHARPERDDQDDRPQREERLDRPEREQRPQNNEDSQPIIREKDEEAEQLVSELIDYFLGAMGVVAETYIREDDEEGSMTFEIEGQDAGLLIGRRGETLQALQFLIRMVTNRQLGRKAYVVIDIEDYRERRVQMLRRLARRTAGRVASSGRDDSLEPMSPAERRIVHMALAGHSEVRTESEGEGNQRRVVIFPTD